MALLYGWQRKVDLLPLSLVIIGWVVFSIGFVWSLVDDSDFATSPILFPEYVILVGGPFVYLLGVAQAILPGTASSVVGIPATFVSSVYLVSAGSRTYGGVDYIITVIKSDNLAINAKLLLMFIGALVITLAWCFVMMLTVGYKSRHHRRDQYELFDPPNRRPSRSKCPFTPGVARCLSIPFLLLSAAGWCVATVGLVRSNVGTFTGSFAEYGSIIVGPLLFLAALLHAGCSGGASIVMGVFTSILSSVYTVFMGFIVFLFGTQFYVFCHDNGIDCSLLHSSLNINWIYAFSGGVGSLFFWTFVQFLWPFYRHHSQGGGQGSGAPINAANSQNIYGTMRLEESFKNTDYSGASPSNSSQRN